MEDDNDVVTDCFESSFKDSIKDMCGIVSILHVEFTKEYPACIIIANYAQEDCFVDPKSYLGDPSFLLHSSTQYCYFQSSLGQNEITHEAT